MIHIFQLDLNQAVIVYLTSATLFLFKFFYILVQCFMFLSKQYFIC